MPRFAYETHLDALSGKAPHWPHSTRSISQLRLSLKVRPKGFFTGLAGLKTVHIDIVDYPGEWLLDLPLLKQSYDEWSEQALQQARSPARASHAKGWLAQLEGGDPTAPLDEPTAQALAEGFKAWAVPSARRSGGVSGVDILPVGETRKGSIENAVC